MIGDLHDMSKIHEYIKKEKDKSLSSFDYKLLQDGEDVISQSGELRSIFQGENNEELALQAFLKLASLTPTKVTDKEEYAINKMKSLGAEFKEPVNILNVINIADKLITDKISIF